MKRAVTWVFLHREKFLATSSSKKRESLKWCMLSRRYNRNCSESVIYSTGGRQGLNLCKLVCTKVILVCMENNSKIWKVLGVSDTNFETHTSSWIMIDVPELHMKSIKSHRCLFFKSFSRHYEKIVHWSAQIFFLQFRVHRF